MKTRETALFYAVKTWRKRSRAKYAKDNKLSSSETLKYLGNDERLAFKRIGMKCQTR